ncbi:hypothetical protein RCC89_11375 [Cytophagaceae bacterium ABcell3]|nr:hypothetical protein RCC89_11375 [Cytophagaceae bacterium ABcell3]
MQAVINKTDVKPTGLGQVNKRFVLSFIKECNLVTEVEEVVSGYDQQGQQEQMFIRFKLWDNHFSYALLKGLFALGGRPDGFVIFVNNRTKDFFFSYNEEKADEAVNYLQSLFGQLNNEMVYRLYLTRKLKLESEFSETLEKLKGKI